MLAASMLWSIVGIGIGLIFVLVLDFILKAIRLRRAKLEIVKDQESKGRIRVLDESGDESDDEMLIEAINQAWRTGRPVEGIRGKDGSFEVREVPDDEPPKEGA